MDSTDMCINCRAPDSQTDQHRPQAMETFIYMHLKRKARKKNSSQTSKDEGQNSETNSPRRDTELPDIKNMQWTENAHGVGTIPGHMSIRAPPTSIGIGGKKEKLIGITNHEVSERYIVKLQKDRERNNQAVFRSLENLPITIRHVPKNRIHSEPTVYTARAAIGAEARPSSMKSMSSEDITYQPFLNTTDVNLDAKSSVKKPADKSVKEVLRSEFKRSKVAGPMCPHLMSLSACRKCARIKKRRRRPDVKKETVSSVTTGILGNDLDIQAEGNSNLSQDVSYNSTHSEPAKVVHTSGFQGHQLRATKSVKVPSKKTSSAFGLPASGNSTFQKKYARVFDSNQQIHFVNTSLMSGQRVGTLGKTFRKLPAIRAAGESQRIRESTEVFAIKSVQRSNDPFPKTSQQSVPLMDDDVSPAPIPIQPMHSFASDLSDMPLVNLDGREHVEPSEGDNDKGSFVNTHGYSVPKSDIKLQNVDETKHGMDTSLTRSDLEVLTCRARHMTPGRTDSKPNLYKNTLGNHDEGHQKGRVQTYKTTSRQSQKPNKSIAPDMQFSVRIEYKKTDDEPTPRESTYSEILNVPRWVEKEKSNVESLTRENVQESMGEENPHEQKRYIRNQENVGDVDDYQRSKGNSYPDDNVSQDPESNDSNGKSEVGFKVGEIHFSSQEMVDYNDNKHDSSLYMTSERNVDISDKNINVPNVDNMNTVVSSKELRQKSSPESGFVSLPCGSDEANVVADDATVESDDSTFESVQTVSNSEGKRVNATVSDLDTGDGHNEVNADENTSFETEAPVNSFINGSDVTNKNKEVSSQKNDDFSHQPSGHESPGSVEEVGGGFFVTNLDPAEAEESENKGVPSSNDSGIAQEDLNDIQDYTNENLQVTTSSRNVMMPSRIGIGLSHDIQA